MARSSGDNGRGDTRSASRSDASHGGAGLTLHDLTRLAQRRWLLVASCAIGGVAAATAILAVRAPAYRATASLQLEADRSASGILGDLAALSRPPLAGSEIEVLTSRSIAEIAVAHADGASLATPQDPSGVRALGLTTLVDDEGRATLAPFWPGTRRPATPGPESPRLFADLTERDEGAPETVRITFLDALRVRISVAGAAALLPGSPDTEERAFTPGTPIEYGGLALVLEPRGDVAGRTYVVRRLDADEALERVRKRTRAVETMRNSGVVEVTFDDSDPERAADTVNALCNAYLERSEQRDQRRASQTLHFIEGQLTDQMRALAEAERQVVELQRAAPRTIEVGKSAEALIERLKDVEVERMELALSLSALREAGALLDAGDLDGLARLDRELSDPVAAAYVEQIATLQGEASIQGRNDGGAWRALVQAKQAELRLAAESVQVAQATLRHALLDLERGEEEACARIAAVDPQGRGEDPLTTAYAQELAAESAHAGELRKEFTDEHPDVLASLRKRDDLRARILAIGRTKLSGLTAQADEYQRLQGGYARRLELAPGEERERIATAVGEIRTRLRSHLAARATGLAAREEDLGRASRDLDERLGELPEDVRALAEPRRRLESHAEIVKLLLARQKEAEITRAATVAAADFIDVAVPPRRPIGPSIPAHLIAGGLIGLLAGLLGAWLRESADSGIISSAELESATGLPVLGAIPDFRRGRLRVENASPTFLALRDDPEGPIAEAYRSLRANLKFVLANDEGIRVLAFTSCSQGEGKSVTNIDVALAFALGGKRVLLVDADMRRPAVARYLGLSNVPGLAEILSGSARWQECVQATHVPQLSVVVAGRQPRSPGDLLAGEACDQLIHEMREAYDLVVFDVPPALAVADTEAFASRLDAVVLLARSRWLTRSVLARTADRLRGAGANLIGCVLNADRPNRSESKYGYGYGYGYGASPARGERGDRARRRETVGSSRED